MSKSILCIGLTCIDIVSICKSYPIEDSSNRSETHYWSRGGNASNDSTVLAILGDKVSCLSYINEKDFLCNFILDDFSSFGIDTKHLCFYGGDDTNKQTNNSSLKPLTNCAPIPLSCCLLSLETGTRTITHYNGGAPEVSWIHFENIDLKNLEWVHFEGRVNVEDIEKMVSRIRAHNQSYPDLNITISLELEKCRPEIDSLMDKGDVTFVSKDRAKWKGFSNYESAINGLLPQVAEGSLLVIPWGDEGSVAMKKDGGKSSLVFVEAHHPHQVVNTLGAGDTFIAAIIHNLNQDKELLSNGNVRDALEFASRIAGKKCGVHGFEALKKLLESNELQQV